MFSQIVFVLYLLINYLIFLPKIRFAYFRSAQLRLNYYIITFLVTIVVIFFISINSSIWSSYEKYSSTPYYYNWLEPKSILDFPFDQLKIWAKDPKVSRLTQESNTNKKDIYNINYIFVFDKSGSTSPKKSDTTVRRLVITKIKEDVKKLINIRDKRQFPSDEIEFPDKNLLFHDYLASIFIKNIFNAKTLNKDTISFSFFSYYGDNCIKNFISGNTKVDNINHNFFDAITKYFSSCKTYNKIDVKKKNTNFKNIFESINYPTISDKSINNPTQTNILVLVSDFEHEPKSGETFKMLSRDMDFISDSLRFDKIALLKLSNHDPNDGSSDSTISIIQRNFNSSLLYSYTDDIIKNNPDNIVQSLYSVASSTIIDTTNSICFFYPSISQDAKISANSKINFDKKNNHDNTFLATFYNPEYPVSNNPEKLVFGNHYNLFVNNPKFIETKNLDNDITLTINSMSKFSNNTYLDISQPDEIITNRYPIVLLEKVSFTCACLLSISYILILFFLCLNTSYYLLCTCRSFTSSPTYNAFAFESYPQQLNKELYVQYFEIEKKYFIIFGVFQILFLISFIYSFFVYLSAFISSMSTLNLHAPYILLLISMFIYFFKFWFYPKIYKRFYEGVEYLTKIEIHNLSEKIDLKEKKDPNEK